MAHTLEKSQPLASKLNRIYAPRIISDHIMVQEDFERLRNFLLETEGLPEVSDDMRDLVEEEWPELVNKRLHVRRAKNGTPSVHPMQGDEIRAVRRLQREQGPSAHVFLSERGGGNPPRRLRCTHESRWR